MHKALATAAGLIVSFASAAQAKDTPFACNRNALSPAERKRHFEELGPALRKLAVGVHELPDGYALQFRNEASTYKLLAEWAYQEALCCPFFDIAVRIDREVGPLWLRLSGRPGTKEFIEHDLGTWIAPPTSRER